MKTETELRPGGAKRDSIGTEHVGNISHRVQTSTQESLEYEPDIPDELSVNVRVNGVQIQAQLDTGARSVWVSDAWYRRHIGTPQPDQNEDGALAADSSELDVTGSGRLTFQWWGRVFKDHPVRILRGLKVPMLFGLRIQLEVKLFLDIGAMRGSFRIDGHWYQGRLNEGQADPREAVRAIVEDKDVDAAIRTVNLTEFSPDLDAQEELRAVLWECRDVFKGMGCVRDEEHVIAMKPNAKPVVMRARRLSPKEIEAEREMVTKLVTAGILEPCTSANAARNVFVPKKDFGLRCTGDFRGINDQTIPDKYPAEDPNKHIEWLAHKRIISCLDLKDGYYQILLAAESRHWTAVSTCLGLFQYTRLAQGLMNSGATFQRVVNRILGDMKGVTAEGYMDDISIGTENELTHIAEVHKLLQRLLAANMRVKWSKCAFGKREVEVLGHKVSHNSILPSDTHVNAIAELQEPSDGDSLTRFIGIVNYFSAHIDHSAEKLIPLHDVLRGTDWNKRKSKRASIVIPDWDSRWGPAQSAAWRCLKGDLTNPRLLAAPRSGLKKRIETDASDNAIGAVLLQEDPSTQEWDALAFTAKRLKPSELKYTVSEKECLGVVHALRSWRHYVQGEDLEVHTDHEALLWLMDNAQLRGRLARWVWTIQNIPFTISHRAGSTLIVADTLSRDVFPPPTCPHCREVLHAIKEVTPLPTVTELKHASQNTIEHQRARLEGDTQWSLDADNLVLRKVGGTSKIWVPEPLRESVLRHYHGNRLHGHYGKVRTMDRVSERFWWKGIEESVIEFLKKCNVCALERVARPKTRQGKLGTYQVKRRGELVATDILTISPASSEGHTKVLVAADALTRWAFAVPLKDELARTVADALYTGWFCKFGPPENLLSDRGRSFAGEVIGRICDRLGVKKIFTSPYHPQCDGMVEKFNSTLLRDIRAFVDANDSNWHELIAGATFRYNTSRHSATGCTPFRATFGAEAFAWDAEVGLRTQQDDREVMDLTTELRTIHEQLFQKTSKARSIAERQYNKTVKERVYEPGERVLVYDNEGDAAIGRKLRRPWLGPYRVAAKITPLNYVLVGEVTGVEARTHVNRMARFDERVVEDAEEAGGVFPDTRRLIKAVLDWRIREGRAQYQVRHRGRVGTKWIDEEDLPPVVVKTYRRILEQRERLA